LSARVRGSSWLQVDYLLQRLDGLSQAEIDELAQK
jgi:hypothetical protein